MIVKARALVWPLTIIRYHRLSFTLSVIKFFMIVDDSFSRLTTRMIDDSFLVCLCLQQHSLGSFSVSSSNRWRKKAGCRPFSRRKKKTCIHEKLSLNSTPCLWWLRSAGAWCQGLTSNYRRLSRVSFKPFDRPLDSWKYVDDSFGYHQLSSTVMHHLTRA